MKESGGKGVRGCQSLTATHKDQGFEDWKEGVRRNRRARSLGGKWRTKQKIDSTARVSCHTYGFTLILSVFETVWIPRGWVEKKSINAIKHAAGREADRLVIIIYWIPRQGTVCNRLRL